MSKFPSLEKSPNLDQWIEIVSDQQILVHTGKVDIGQRISTALAIIAAEELDVDYDRIQVKRTETGIDPDEGITSGSLSMQNSGEAIRRASATARQFLLKKAATHFDADIADLEIEDGLIQLKDTNRTVSYWDLMEGKPFEIPVDEDVSVKDPENHSQVGQKVTSKGMTEIFSGRYEYLHDMKLPGMLHARVVHPPHYYAKLQSLDEAAVERATSSGLTIVRDGSFLAVVGAEEFSVLKASRRLADAADWQSISDLPDADLFSSLTSNERVSLPVKEGGIPAEEPVPELGEPSSQAVATLSARYEKPYHMHGTIGPSASAALYQDGIFTIWSHSQGIYPLRGSIAEALKLDPEKIHIKFVPGAGCYGHNGADDVSFEAALIARACPGQPILLKWTREDEHAWEPYGSAMVCELRASVDKEGKVLDWSHESYGDTFMGRPAPGRPGSATEKLLAMHFVEDSVDWPIPMPTMRPHVGIHRNIDPLYEFPSKRMVKNLVRNLPLRTSALRTLGAFANVVAIESFMDELAEAAETDPFEFRLQHLQDQRARDLLVELRKLMENADAGKADNVGSGIAFSRYKNSAAYCATGIEVEVDDQAQVKLLRAWITADSGEIVDPSGTIAQLEGGLIQAASWTLHEQVTYNSGGVTSRDWDTYPILRFDNIPEVETHLMKRPGYPFLGVGEAVAGPVGGAIANAIYNASGLRLRRMPFDADAVMAAAMQD